MTRRVGGAAGLLAAVMCLSGCVTPALNDGAFVANVTSALDSAVSETATGQLVLQARLSGDATRPYADTVVTDSEGAIAPIEASFGGVDPPNQTDDGLRSSVLDLLGEAGDALANARIAVRRDDPEGMRTANDELQAANAKLVELRKSLE